MKKNQKIFKKNESQVKSKLLRKMGKEKAKEVRDERNSSSIKNKGGWFNKSMKKFEHKLKEKEGKEQELKDKRNKIVEAKKVRAEKGQEFRKSLNKKTGQPKLNMKVSQMLESIEKASS